MTRIDPGRFNYETRSADLRARLDSVPEPCLLIDANLVIVAANDSYLDATVTRRDEIIGRALFEVFPDDCSRAPATGQRELQDANRRLRQMNDEKSNLLARVSHELRTPLNAVLGFARLLQMDELAEQQREAVEHILRGGKHLLALVDELLDICRAESGDLPLLVEPVAVVPLLRGVLALIRPIADERSIDIVTEFTESDDRCVRADQRRLEQVVLNLLSNAVKYNRIAGTITVSLHEPVPGRLQVLVADTGSGIPVDRQREVFTPFERLDAPARGIPGTGIGLALSRQLAERMHGSLDFRSIPGRGSTFWIELPLGESRTEPVAPRQVGLVARSDPRSRRGRRRRARSVSRRPPHR